ncbi:A24 family peptidase [Actinoplanes sp. NPDC026623]|uniref:A24 family peptidase n=1 Tax=Actinoplanes sp. NPDC026623 TaxID=3155610 RepID=UPI0033C9C1E4
MQDGGLGHAGLLIGAVAAITAAAAWWPRVAYRLSVAPLESPRAECLSCGQAFAPGRRGWLRGGSACRNCPQPWWITSLLAGAMSGALTWRAAAFTGEHLLILTCWLAIIQAGVLLSLIDLAVMRLPVRLVMGLAAIVCVCVGTAALLSAQPQLLLTAMMAGLAVGAFYLLAALALPSQIGLGDVRLATILGFALGVNGWTAVVLGTALPYLLAPPFALALLLRGGSRKAQLPFGPFLIAGAVIAQFLTGS